ncbi:hypothetical protein VB715_05245 [Crocosphaera sp. UHCC 0190]|uniref:hypothetical protein n=1 Tax=Crocosphaera sp. UHCC 0190 TaxID=3110246 RepID=UPI002B21B16C|nr:hypothetical protein [Crocosphaera sp. UHCC 0190]MEA5509165.1 hypothetical protein [Crocosphaera sp. UHCC 0190]
MSDRNLAEVISHYMGKDYAVVFNDIYKVSSREIPDSNLVDKIKQHLLVYGYQNWLEDN